MQSPIAEHDSDDADVILKAFQRSTEAYKFCPNRVWLLASSLPDNAHSLPRIFPAADELKAAFQHHFNHQGELEHQNCTSDTCQLSQKDATKVQQRHESAFCRIEPCTPTRALFPSDILNTAIQLGDQPTAWQLYGRRTVTNDEDFMAISHVWSDGTGVGPDGRGVNTCLFNFFRDIAYRLDCTGIWWDTICVPSDRILRALAINKMHLNYSRAKVTLVHDCFLRQTEWVDAEMACLAIVLSPWFSRGWTALELARSNTVKLIFRQADDFVLKDLDHDILANPRTRRHRILAKAISSLRTSITNVDQLLRVLKPRYTSWPKDMINIAGLMSEISMDTQSESLEDNSEKLEHQTNVRAVKNIGLIGYTNLFHNLPTINDGTSWCPSKLLSLPLATSEALVRIDEYGNVVGKWRVARAETILSQTTISTGDARGLQKLNIQARLKQPARHRVLLEPSPLSLRQGLIVEVLNEDYSGIQCQFVGSIVFQSELNESNILFSDILVTILNTPSRKESWYSSVSRSKTNIIIDRSEHREECSEYSRKSGSSTETRTAESFTINAINSYDTDPEQSRFFFPNSHTPTLFSKSLYQLNLQRAKLLLQNYRFQQESEDIRNTLLAASYDEGYRSVFERLTGKAWSPCDTSFLLFKLLFDFPDPNGQTPLLWAARRGFSAAVSLLTLWYEVDIDFRDSSYKTSLHWAIEAKYWNVAQRLIERGAAIDVEDCHHRTPLSYAAAHGHMLSVARLLDEGSNVNQMDTSGHTPLSFAAQNGHDLVVQLLVSEGANIDLRTNEPGKRSPLSYAAENGHTTVVETLLNVGAKADSRDGDGRSPLSYAAEQEHEGVVRLLLGRGEVEVDSRDDFDLRPLSYASKTGADAIVHLLLMAGAELNDEYHPPLMDAVRFKHGPVVARLLNAGADVNLDGQHEFTPLSLAAHNGDEDIFQDLLGAGAQVNAKTKGGRTALCAASEKGHELIARQLIQLGAHVEISRLACRSPLSLASENGHEAIVLLLLDEKANIKSICDNERTPLSYAASGGHKTIVQHLIKRGAKADCKDGYDKRPLMHAAQSGHSSVVRLLLDRGVDPHRKDISGRTALHNAALSGCPTTIELLLKKKCRVNCKTERGQTPLFYAVFSNKPAAVQLLLKCNAKVDSFDINGESILRHAAGMGNEAIVQLLIEAGAPLNGGKKQTSYAFVQEPLQAAAGQGHEAVVRMLIRAGANINGTIHEYGPWRASCDGHHPAVTQLLLDAGAKIPPEFEGIV